MVLGPTQPPIQWVTRALSLGVKRLWREADHSPPSSAEIKEWVESFMAWCLVKHRDNFIFTFTWWWWWYFDVSKNNLIWSRIVSETDTARLINSPVDLSLLETVTPELQRPSDQENSQFYGLSWPLQLWCY